MKAILDWYRDSGPTMNLILVVALAGVAIIVERFFVVVVRARGSGRIFMERVIQLVRAEKLEDAIKLCARSKSVLPDVGLLVLRARSREEEELRDVADAARLAVVPHLMQRLSYLRALAIVAMLLGVLGTIYGLHDAFAAAALTPNAADRGTRLAAGVALSLEATIAGLVVAVPLVAAYAYLCRQAEIVAEHVAEFSIRLINALTDRPDVRLGHR